MTLHPCTFPHILGRAPRAADPEPAIELREDADDSPEGDIDIEAFAAIDFEPLDPSVNLLPSREEWQETHRTIFYNLQLALSTLRKTKAELVAGVPSLTTDDEDLVKRMVESLNDTSTTLKMFAEIITKAELRWLCAAAVHATSQGDPP